MALFNESLEGRFARIVGALHSMKGPNPMPQVAPEIQHVLELQDDIDRFNHHFLAGTLRYSSGSVFVGADATHFGTVQFQNPAGSGVIVTIERLLILLNPNDNAVVKLYPGAIATSPANSFPLDGRAGPNQKSALVNFINNQLAGQSGNTIDEVLNDLASNSLRESLLVRGLILPPNNTNGNAGCGILGIQGSAVNKPVQAFLVHRERAANPAELRAP